MKQNQVPVGFNQFLRVDEDTDIHKLRNGTVAELLNMVLDNPYGALSIRGGFTSKNTNVTTTAQQRIVNVVDSASTEYFLAGYSGAIAKSTTGSWSDVKTGLSGTGWFQFTRIKDGLIITTGADKPFVISGTAFATTHNLEIAEPDVTGITCQRTSDSAGELESDASYRWILIYKTAVGEQSNASHPFTYPASSGTYSQQTNTTNKKFLFRNLPVSTDPRVTHKVLYRTEGWNDTEDTTTGLIYYKVTELANDETIHVDNRPDIELDYGDAVIFTRLPNWAEYVTRSNGRVWLGNFELPKITQFKPPIACQDHGSTSSYGGANWADSTVKSNIEVTADVVNSTGLIPSYYYQYMYTYVDFDGNESLPSYQTFTFQVGATINGGSYHKVTTALYDAGRMGSNQASHESPVIKYRRIYRTLGHVADFTPNTETFYLVEQQTIDTGNIGSKLSTSYVDDNADDSSTPYAPETEEQISAVTWSQVDRPAYVPVENVRQIFAEEAGDYLTGILDDGNGLLIWKKESIVKFYHTGAPQNWYIRKVWNDFGCDNPKSLIKVGDTYYFSYRSRVYSMRTGQAPIDISYGRYASFDTMDIIGGAGNNKWIIYGTTSGTNHYLMVYDVVVKTWYKFTLGTNDLTALCVKKFDDLFTGNLNELFIVVAKKLFVYDSASTDDEISGSTVAVAPSVTFPLFGIEGLPSKLRQFVLEWKNTGTGTLTFTLGAMELGYTADFTDPDDTGFVRFRSGNFPTASSNHFELTLSGIIDKIYSIRGDFRPKRQGVG